MNKPMDVLILVNGDLHLSPQLLQQSKNADYIIAADGGAKHCVPLQLTPDILIGDLDSISGPLLKEFQNAGVEIQQYPVRKNATDLELAIDHAIAIGATKIFFAGMLGGRWDMSLANIFLLAHDKYKDIRFLLSGDNCVMHILHPGTHALTTQMGQRVSLLPLKGDGENISLTGFEYPLDQQTIPFGSSIGVSNVTVGTKVQIEHTGGILLLVLSTCL